RPPARAPAPRAGAARGTSPPGRARAPRRPRRSACRAARRRSTRVRRCGRWSPRARARGRELPTAFAAVPSGAPRTHRPRPDPRRAPRWHSSPLRRRPRRHLRDSVVSVERTAHATILRYGPAVADVRTFRAERYAEAAGDLADLVAPPYDVISAEERER